MGRVEALFIAFNKGEAMISLDSVELTAGAGIEGDRYALGIGAYSQSTPSKPRDITLIAREAVDAANAELVAEGLEPFPPELTRRNVLTYGIDLNELVGREFRLGSARLIGVELADPCHRPTMLAGRRHKAFPDAFNDRGGLRASVLESGVVELGDAIVPVEGQLAA